MIMYPKKEHVIRLLEEGLNYKGDYWYEQMVKKAREVIALLERPECDTCHGSKRKIVFQPGQREFGGDASTSYEIPCPGCQKSSEKLLEVKVPEGYLLVKANSFMGKLEKCSSCDIDKPDCGKCWQDECYQEPVEKPPASEFTKEAQRYIDGFREYGWDIDKNEWAIRLRKACDRLDAAEAGRVYMVTEIERFKERIKELKPLLVRAYGYLLNGSNLQKEVEKVIGITK